MFSALRQVRGHLTHFYQTFAESTATAPLSTSLIAPGAVIPVAVAIVVMIMIGTGERRGGGASIKCWHGYEGEWSGDNI